MEAAGLDPFDRWDTHPTDSHFCQHCEDLGITRWVHAAYVLNHGDLPKEDVVFLRRAYSELFDGSGTAVTHPPSS